MVQDCPLNPYKKVEAKLNLLETILLSENESKEVTPLMAVTRAQAQRKAAQPSTDKEGSAMPYPNSWKARKQRRVATKKR